MSVSTKLKATARGYHSMSPTKISTVSFAATSPQHLPDIHNTRSSSVSPTKELRGGKDTFNPGCPWDRFTKLRASLVSSLLSKYNRQPEIDRKVRPDLAYNVAVLEVDKMMKRGKVTEEQIKQLQIDFAEGLLRVPQDWQGAGGRQSPERMDVHSPTATQATSPTHLITSPNASKKSLLAGLQGSRRDMANTITSPNMTGSQKEASLKHLEQGGDTGIHPYTDLSQHSVQGEQEPAEVPEPSGGASVAAPSGGFFGAKKRETKIEAKEMDSWTMMTLMRDVKHLENEKKRKKEQGEQKVVMRRLLQEQMKYKKEMETKEKEQVTLYAVELERQKKAHEEEQRIVLEKKKIKIEEHKVYEAAQREAVKQRKLDEAELEKREADIQVEIFKKQLQEERKKLDKIIKDKAKQNEIVMKENEKNLEIKRQLKEEEAREQQRLFHLQNEMYEKQERRRREAEEERQERLRRAERQGKEQFDKKLAFEEVVEQRMKAEQALKEKLENEELERRRQRKLAADIECNQFREEQIAHMEAQRAAALRDKKELMVRYKMEAKQYEEELRLEKVKKRNQKKAMKVLLDAQKAEKKISTIDMPMTQLEHSLNAQELSTLTGAKPEDLLSNYRALCVKDKKVEAD